MSNLTWGKLKYLISLMEDEQLSEEVLLFDGFSCRFIEVECLGQGGEVCSAWTPYDTKMVLFGQKRKE